MWKKRHRYAGGSPKRKRSRWLRWLMLSAAGLIGIIAIVGIIVGMEVYGALTEGLPAPEELDQYKSSLVTHVYDRHDELVADFYIEKRIPVELDDIPLYLQQATIAVEDSRFYSHQGFDLKGILRAMWVNIRAREVREGASTITQQVARTLFLNRERTYYRKLREVILAWRIERRFSKSDILRMYLNQIFYGHNAYGVEAASQIYFSKSARDLTLGEAALIAGLTQAPNKYSPLHNLQLSLQRRHYVLRRMAEEGYLDGQQAREAAAEPVHLRPNYQPINKSPYFVEHVRKYLEEKYGSDMLYRGGLKVYTTLDMRLQEAAVQAVRHGVEAIDKRHGYLGPLRHVALTGDRETDRQLIEDVTLTEDGDRTVREGENLLGVVVEVGETSVQVVIKDSRGVMTSEEGYGWVKEAELQLDFDERRLLETNEIFRPGDVIRVRVDKVDVANQAHLLALQQDPLVQGALIAMEASSGHVLAMIGGYDYVSSQFNRATQALRQPGSAFKPIIYAAALEAGKTPASIIYDRAIVKEDVNEQKMWKPQNYSQKYYGATTLRKGLTHSRNMVTIKLMEEIGVPAVLGAARRLGIQSPLAPYLSLALGSSGVSLLELTASYNTFANAGLHVSPIFITRVLDAHQNVLEEHLPQAERAVSPEIAYVMTSLLQGVVQDGTGRRVQALGRPVAGKTGTTNDFRDAWFFGYTPELVAGVWVGIDDRSVLGHRETGGRVAAPIWLEFMQEAMRDQSITNFPIPPQVRFYRINSESGRQATADTEADTHFEAFVRGTQPDVAMEPAHDLRRNIHRLDRRNRSAARALDGTDHTNIR